MSFDSLLNESGLLWRRAVTMDPIGGEVEEWYPTKVFIQCRIQALSGTERAMMGSKGVDVTHKIFCRPMRVSEKDKFAVRDTVFQIEFVNDVDRLNHHLQLDVRDLRDGGGIGAD